MAATYLNPSLSVTPRCYWRDFDAFMAKVMYIVTLCRRTYWFSLDDSDLNLKIVDFGLVRHADENHAIKGGPKKLKFLGTPPYMPLETIVKRQIGPALDIWSLSCIVLEMITVKQPWEGTKDKMILAIKILFSTSPPNQIPKTFSDQGKDFLMKCFAREPDERWTADMLLIHPFITATQEKSDDCLPSTEEIEAWLCDMSSFVG
ncbi:hypothetical protein GQ457_11G028980 [Hibiscus cannabinus]